MKPVGFLFVFEKGARWTLALMHPLLSDTAYENERSFPLDQKEEARAFAQQLAERAIRHTLILIIEASPYLPIPDDIRAKMETFYEERKKLWAETTKLSTEKGVL